jgi:uncharacterized membrane protein YecN with MAPEG domain
MHKRRKFGELGDYVAMALIIIGFLMMIQPITIVLYSYGFTVILSGVILYNITSHL